MAFRGVSSVRRVHGGNVACMHLRRRQVRSRQHLRPQEEGENQTETSRSVPIPDHSLGLFSLDPVFESVISVTNRFSSAEL